MLDFTYRSGAGLHALHEKQKLLELSVRKLTTDVSTRRNSAYDMVEHFQEQQPAVTDLSKRYVSEPEKNMLILASSVDPRFKALISL